MNLSEIEQYYLVLMVKNRDKNYTKIEEEWNEKYPGSKATALELEQEYEQIISSDPDILCSDQLNLTAQDVSLNTDINNLLSDELSLTAQGVSLNTDIDNLPDSSVETNLEKYSFFISSTPSLPQAKRGYSEQIFRDDISTKEFMELVYKKKKDYKKIAKILDYDFDIKITPTTVRHAFYSLIGEESESSLKEKIPNFTLKKRKNVGYTQTDDELLDKFGKIYKGNFKEITKAFNKASSHPRNMYALFRHNCVKRPLLSKDQINLPMQTRQSTRLEKSTEAKSQDNVGDFSNKPNFYKF